jgi:thioredoxin reductase (NADPH)
MIRSHAEALANALDAIVHTLLGVADRGEALQRRQSRNGALAPLRAQRRYDHLLLFIGADPNTDWLAQCDVALDKKGFARTGEDYGERRHALETNRAGVFATGDVRSGSVKRVAAAVGEGAQVVSAIHAYLARSGSAASAVAITRP